MGGILESVAAYLAFWDTVWRFVFTGIAGLFNSFNTSPVLKPVDSLIGAPGMIGVPTGESYAYIFMTIMLHFIILVAIMDKDRP